MSPVISKDIYIYIYISQNVKNCRFFSISDDTQFLQNLASVVEPQFSFSPVFQCRKSINFLTSKTGRKLSCKEDEMMFSESKECQHQDGGTS